MIFQKNPEKENPDRSNVQNMKIFQHFLNYSRMVKLSHSLFALPFAGLSAVLAFLESNLLLDDIVRLGFLIVVCMVTARSAAMGFNRYVDSEIDRENPRTSSREIPSGILSRSRVLIFVAVSSFLFLFACYLINTLCFLLAFPVLLVLFFYSLAKRFTLLCHFILGFAISLAPLGAWIAILEELSLLPFLFSLGLFFHISGFDILYAIQDADFDTKSRLHSIPAKLGPKASFWIAAFNHLVSLGFFVWAGWEAELGVVYYLTLLLVAFLLLQEHRIARESACEILPPSFYWINSLVSVLLFLGILIDRWREVLGKFQIIANI